MAGVAHKMQRLQACHFDGARLDWLVGAPRNQALQPPLAHRRRRQEQGAHPEHVAQGELADLLPPPPTRSPPHPRPGGVVSKQTRLSRVCAGRSGGQGPVQAES